MKNKRWVISALVSLAIVLVIFFWQLFANWGLVYFQKNFSFSGMVLPLILAFVLFWVCVYVILSGVAGVRKRSADKKARIEEIGEDAWNAEQAEKSRVAMEQYKNAQAEMAARAAEPIKCPRCGSTQISSDKKGFGVGKAVIGNAIAGPIGLAAGNIGAKKVRITCLKCGKQWEAGKG